MKGTAVQPLVHCWGCRSCFWPRLQEGGTASMSWDHLPKCTCTCPEGRTSPKCLGWPVWVLVLADVTVGFSWLFGQKVPLSLPVSEAPAVLEVPCSRLEGCGEISWCSPAV